MEENFEGEMINDVFIKDVKRRLEKSNKFLLYFNTDDIRRLLCIIEGLEIENEIKTKCIKELNKSTTKIVFNICRRRCDLNVNNDND